MRPLPQPVQHRRGAAALRRPILPKEPNHRKGINFNLLIHRIHTGENLKEAGKSYTVIGRNGSINDFTEVRFPAMSPQGSPGDTRNCANCHVNDSQTTSAGMNDVLDPQGFINPVKPNSSACIGCHVPGGCIFAHAGEHDDARRELRRVSRLGRLRSQWTKLHAQY